MFRKHIPKHVAPKKIKLFGGKRRKPTLITFLKEVGGNKYTFSKLYLALFVLLAIAMLMVDVRTTFAVIPSNEVMEEVPKVPIKSVETIRPIEVFEQNCKEASNLKVMNTSAVIYGEVVEKTSETENSVEINGNVYSISTVLYIHLTEDLDKPLLVVNEPISSYDIKVNLSKPFDERFEYTISKELERAISRITYAESGNQPFDGQVCVAEDIRNSLFSGVYGDDLNATCKKQYYTSLEIDSDGIVHLYRSGVELLETTDSTDAAAALAVKGSNLTGILLGEVTKIRAKQHPEWNLDESYYSGGAYFHYAPDLLSSKQLNARKIGQVPVSFKLSDHVFYGKWLNALYALC